MHTLLPSIEALLAPNTLSDLVGQRVTSVATRSLEAEYAKSGSRLLVVETNGGDGPRFILKRVSAAWDWLMRATEDTRCRSVTLWERGVFDQMPPEVEHATVACARDSDGWAILMRDVEGALVPYSSLSVEDNRLFLDTLAAMHAQFFEDKTLTSLELALCRLRHVYGMFSPHTGHREAAGADEIPKRILEGWGLLPQVVAPDVAETVLRLVDDPTPLCEVLSQYPHTLVHGDSRHANLGLRKEEDRRKKEDDQTLTPETEHPTQVVMLDWALAAWAPPAVELGRYLGTNSALLPCTKEEALEMYRASLARRLGASFSDDWWRPQLALAMLGGFVQDGWSIALKSSHWRVPDHQRPHWKADLLWWSHRVREGLQWL